MAEVQASKRTKPSPLPPPPPLAPLHQDSCTAITHFAPLDLEPQLACTTQFFYLPFRMYQTYLGAKLPMEQMHVAFLPGEMMAQDLQLGAGCLLVS